MAILGQASPRRGRASPASAWRRDEATPERNWRWTLFRGVLAIVLALVAGHFPLAALFAFTMVIAAYALIDGIAALAHERRGCGGKHRLAPIVRGISGVVAGVLFLMLPMVAAATYAYLGVLLLALWMLLSGLLEISAAIWLRKSGGSDWLVGVAGAFSLLLGLAILVFIIPDPNRDDRFGSVAHHPLCLGSRSYPRHSGATSPAGSTRLIHRGAEARCTFLPDCQPCPVPIDHSQVREPALSRRRFLGVLAQSDLTRRVPAGGRSCMVPGVQAVLAPAAVPTSAVGAARSAALALTLVAGVAENSFVVPGGTAQVDRGAAPRPISLAVMRLGSHRADWLQSGAGWNANRSPQPARSTS